MAAETESQLLSILPTLIEGLEAFDDYDKVESLFQLAQIIDSAFGDEAAYVCQFLRDNDGINNLLAMVENPDEWLHQTSLLVIGNVATEALDPNAAETKRKIKEVGGFEKMLPHLYSENSTTVTYALGAIRNTCAEREYVMLMQRNGVVRRLQVRRRLQGRRGCWRGAGWRRWVRAGVAGQDDAGARGGAAPAASAPVGVAPSHSAPAPRRSLHRTASLSTRTTRRAACTTSRR